MITSAIAEFDKAYAEFSEAKGYLSLLKETDWSGSKFSVSPDHCEIKITIAGQKYQGAQNYHDAPAVLRKELARVIAKHFDSLGCEALANLAAQAEKHRDEARRIAEKKLSAPVTATTEGDAT